MDKGLGKLTKGALDNFTEKDRYQLNVYRYGLILGAIFFPVYSYSLLQINPDYTEYMSHRLFFSGLWIFAFLLSYLKTPFIKKYITDFIFCCFLAFNYWAIWINYKNNFDANYFAGMFLIFAAINIVSYRIKEVVFFISTSTIMFLWLALSIKDQLAMELSTLMLNYLVLAILSIVVIILKIKEKKYLNQLGEYLDGKVKERTTELQKKNDELEQFTHVLSHDLKTSLHGIATLSEWIKTGSYNRMDDENKAMFDLLLNRTARLEKQLNGIQHYLSYNQNQNEPTVEFNLNKELTHFLNNLKKDHTFEYELIEIPESLKAKKKGLMVVFKNLVLNALEHNREQDLKISIGYQSGANQDKFMVSDNGIGVHPEHHHKIFKLFETIENKDTTLNTGIGLSVCKKIVENLKGQIGVDPKEKGFSIWFSVPKQETQLIKKRN